MDLVHYRHCKGEYGFRLNIYVLTKGICSKRLIIHEDFPELTQCVVLVLFLFFAYKTFLRPFPSCVFLRFHSRSALAQQRPVGFPITSSGASSQNIFLEPPSLAPPGVCRETAASGRSRFDYSTDSTCVTQEKSQSKCRVQSSRRSASVAVTNMHEAITDGQELTSRFSQASAFPLHRVVARADFLLHLLSFHFLFQVPIPVRCIAQ